MKFLRSSSRYIHSACSKIHLSCKLPQQAVQRQPPYLLVHCSRHRMWSHVLLSSRDGVSSRYSYDFSLSSVPNDESSQHARSEGASRMSTGSEGWMQARSADYNLYQDLYAEPTSHPALPSCPASLTGDVEVQLECPFQPQRHPRHSQSRKMLFVASYVISCIVIAIHGATMLILVEHATFAGVD